MTDPLEKRREALRGSLRAAVPTAADADITALIAELESFAMAVVLDYLETARATAGGAGPLVPNPRLVAERDKMRARAA